MATRPGEAGHGGLGVAGHDGVLRQLVSVFKLRIGFVITLSALAGLAVTPGAHLPAWQVATLALAVFLSSASAGAFNQFCERDLDAMMSRTRDRPFVTGAFGHGPAWMIGILLLLAVAVAMAAVLNWMVALNVFLGAFTYAVVYTLWLKRRTWLNIVVGGLAGSFAVLAGAAAVDPHLSPAAITLAVVWFLWTPPHFWALATAIADDYAAAGVPMLPVVKGPKRTAEIILASTILLVAVSLVPIFFGMGWLYFAGAASGGALFIWRSCEMVADPSRKRAMAAFFASLGQLTLLMAGAVAEMLLH